ncbi:hypothetical protein WSM22_27250 [Cytophagales bacterium WSM2-2]|nr:hypothetical protein WSM22_27250 [Cytophagales bacterium WSM2-2]
MIYHITTSQDWESQKDKPDFLPADYHKEGFIHCCTSEQLAGVMERYFKGKTGLALLHLDESKLKAELKFEASTNDEEFPHLYGAINREAIIAVKYI